MSCIQSRQQIEIVKSHYKVDRLSHQSYNDLICNKKDHYNNRNSAFSHCFLIFLHVWESLMSPPPPGQCYPRMQLASEGESWEEKMEYGSSLSVSGWQGFSSTPSHSSNEVIKWMNEAWKETCCWGQCVPKMPLPTPQPFAFLCFAVEDSKRKSPQEDEAISAMCLQHIYQSWVACMQPAWCMLVTIGLWNRSEDRWGVKICEIFNSIQYFPHCGS